MTKLTTPHAGNAVEQAVYHLLQSGAAGDGIVTLDEIKRFLTTRAEELYYVLATGGYLETPPEAEKGSKGLRMKKECCLPKTKTPEGGW